jgi:hypothetical protein
MELTFTVSVFAVGITSGVAPELELQAQIPKKAIHRMATNIFFILGFI